ncbi:unnamed protein product [Effrenium voratum]|nr:unnamed protein product [Effrenium voratum]
MQALQMQNLQGMNLQGLMGQMGLGQMGQMGQMGLVAPQSVPAVGGSSGQPVPGRLFLTKVPQEVTKADLEAYFGQFGELADVYVHGKGIAFVSLKDPLVSQQILQNKEHFVKPGVSVLVDQALDRPAKGNGEGKGGRGAPVQNLQMVRRPRGQRGLRWMKPCEF